MIRERGQREPASQQQIGPLPQPADVPAYAVRGQRSHRARRHPAQVGAKFHQSTRHRSRVTQQPGRIGIARLLLPVEQALVPEQHERVPDHEVAGDRGEPAHGVVPPPDVSDFVGEDARQLPRAQLLGQLRREHDHGRPGGPW